MLIPLTFSYPAHIRPLIFPQVWWGKISGRNFHPLITPTTVYLKWSVNPSAVLGSCTFYVQFKKHVCSFYQRTYRVQLFGWKMFSFMLCYVSECYESVLQWISRLYIVAFLASDVKKGLCTMYTFMHLWLVHVKKLDINSPWHLSAISRQFYVYSVQISCKGVLWF